MRLTILVCLLLAGISLLGPSEPSYDPWAWLVWGREIAHLGLNTTGGPSWKPLPVAFTALFAPLSKIDDGIPAALWIVVARAGALLAAALAFKVTGRVLGGGLTRRIVAGVVAVVALVLTPDWIRYVIHGNEVPLAVALGLWAIDRHLDGDRRGALVLGGLVCLARPELFGFVALYGAYMWWVRRRDRPVVAAVLAIVPAAWLIPSWWGSGDPFFAGTQARSEPSWSLSLAAVPWRAALGVAQAQAWFVLEAASVGAVALALVAVARETRRPGRTRPAAFARRPEHGFARPPGAMPRPAHPGTVVALAGFAAVVVALFAAMTQAGFSGNVRYVLPALVAIAVLGGVGAGLLVDAGARLGERLASARPAGAVAGAVVVGALLLVGATAEIRGHVDAADVEAREAIERSDLHKDLERAVDDMGPRYVTLFGPATVNRSFQTHLAWELGLPLSDVQGARGRGMLFRAPAQPVAGIVRLYPRTRSRTLVARVGKWKVSARPPGARHVFSWPIDRFNLCTARGLAATSAARRCSITRAGNPEAGVRRDRGWAGARSERARAAERRGPDDRRSDVRVDEVHDADEPAPGRRGDHLHALHRDVPTLLPVAHHQPHRPVLAQPRRPS